ncbi:hypothetical protein SDC9_122192 [bioreactor metagenome]|uniref:Uncharacterized protein n=1 Tax=bioreactor metagenome TaxID=1076179 RepID=A0A645CE40_9ZZZZ
MAFELEQVLRYTQGQHRRKALTHIAAFEILFLLFDQVHLTGVFIEGFCYRCLGAGFVRAAILGADVVDERKDRLRIAVVVLEGELNLDPIGFPAEIHHIVQCILFFI